MMVQLAVILAGGQGTRLGPLSRDRPKGFLQLGGKTLIERSIDNLLDAGIRRILIGTGYKAHWYEKLADTRSALQCVHSPRYATTGSMATLFQMQELIDQDFLLLESDLIYERRALLVAVEDPGADVILASGLTHSGDEVYIQRSTEGLLTSMSKNPPPGAPRDTELVGITKLSATTYVDLCQRLSQELERRPTMDYEDGLVVIAAKVPIKVTRIEDLIWAEIDDAHHLARARDRILPLIEQVDA